MVERQKGKGLGCSIMIRKGIDGDKRGKEEQGCLTMPQRPPGAEHHHHTMVSRGDSGEPQIMTTGIWINEVEAWIC